MHRLLRSVGTGVVCILALATGQFGSTQPAGEASGSTSCVGPAYRQFDFWAGDWDVFDADKPGSPVARAHVHPVLDGCVLLEDYEDNEGAHGQSFSIYDASRNIWHQSWVTNRGTVLVIEGEFRDGEMVLSGVDQAGEHQERHVRGLWKPIDGGVRESAVRSMDGGKNWTPWFNLIFRPAVTLEDKGASSSDEQTVAGLDSEYQAAVKVNDVAVMARVLADDFVLVTGSGKHYSKADLLDEARSGQYIYEHQEDTERTVRLHGDVAIVTAKLWEKGTNNGKPFDYLVWFSDTYTRSPSGWQYVFGQSSLPLPPSAPR